MPLIILVCNEYVTVTYANMHLINCNESFLLRSLTLISRPWPESKIINRSILIWSASTCNACVLIDEHPLIFKYVFVFEINIVQGNFISGIFVLNIFCCTEMPCFTYQIQQMFCVLLCIIQYVHILVGKANVLGIPTSQSESCAHISLKETGGCCCLCCNCSCNYEKHSNCGDIALLILEHVCHYL